MRYGRMPSAIGQQLRSEDLPRMPTCFVIQPFSSKFEKRFQDVYKPALEKAGLDPYRVDQDPSTEGVMDSIEQKIRDATICLADITIDNPNVWYELGYAFAAGRSVVMVCSGERKDKLPFDIQHQTVIMYEPESESDFVNLGETISTRAKALVKKNAVREVVEAQQVAPTGGLSQAEISVLAIAAAETAIPGNPVKAWSLRHDAERAGLTGIGFGVALRGLQRKRFVDFVKYEDEDGAYDAVNVTDDAWTWIDNNDSLFSLFREKSPVPELTEDDILELTEDDIPF